MQIANSSVPQNNPLFFCIETPSTLLKQLCTSDSSSNLLTYHSLNQTIEQRKIQFIQQEHENIFDNPYYIGTTCLVASFTIACLIATTFFFIDPVSQKVPLCSRKVKCIMPENSLITYYPDVPCYLIPPKGGEKFFRMEHPYNVYTHIPVVAIGPLALLAAILTTIFSYCIGSSIYSSCERKKNKEYNLKVTNYNHCLTTAWNQLSFNGNLKAELTSKDAAVIFPFLSDAQLKLLHFKQLEKAKSLWPEKFQKKLDDHLFSKKQLAIWRLFNHYIKASALRQGKILSKNLYQDLIVSEPLFFQKIIQNLKLFNRLLA